MTSALLLLTAPPAHARQIRTRWKLQYAGGSDRTNKPEEDDFTQTPYTEYGSFNEEKEEEEDTKFFQYGASSE